MSEESESLWNNGSDIYSWENSTSLLDSNFTNFTDCGERALDEDYKFWIDGILVAVVGTAGFFGNLLALVVLSRPQLRDVFHQLLFALACFDILFIVFGGINYTHRAFKVSTDIYTYLFPYLVHPMSHIAMAGTIFMTLAISIERYLGLCHPLLPPHARKPWMYILPVVVVSLGLNLPKFFEIKVTMGLDLDGNEVPMIDNTDLRHNKHYVLGYVMWTRLFSTAVIPVIMLVYLNIRIIIDLMNSTKVQRFGSARRQRKEINLSIVLLCIVVIFFCCHAARIILDIYEFSNIDKIMACRPNPWWPPEEMQNLVFFSHIMMILNSSVNFIVYCLVGHTFRREMCRAFGLRKYARVPGGGLSRRSSKYDFSMAVPSTMVTYTAQNSQQTTTFTTSASTSRFMPTSGSNGNFRTDLSIANNGTNSVKCVALVNKATDTKNTNDAKTVNIAKDVNFEKDIDEPKTISDSTGGNDLKHINFKKNVNDVPKDTNDSDGRTALFIDNNDTNSIDSQKDFITNNGLIVTDDKNDQIVTNCLIENFTEKKNAIFV